MSLTQTEFLLMSNKEINRIAILDRLIAKGIKQNQAAKLLRITVRQVRRLKQRYVKSGGAGLIHQGRSRSGNRQINQQQITMAIDLIKQHYQGFGPTLAYEKLVKFHGVSFSVERLRQAMIKEQLWTAKRRRKPQIHQMRPRRPCEGELVQLDGSPHDWFEGRGESCTLLVYIDDATGKLKHLQFVDSESTEAYFVATKTYLLLHGKPLAFYLDKHGVFRVNSTRAGSADVTDSVGVTQFGRAMSELDIELIFANSPQAKGRVERANQTLQDRLTKELRLQGISDQETANAYLPEFIADYNVKFAVKPQDAADLHRPLRTDENLDKVFTKRYLRILSNNLTFQYRNQLCQIKTPRPSYSMRRAPIIIQEDLQGMMSIHYQGKRLNYEILDQRPKAEIIDSKHVNLLVDQIKARRSWVPPDDHPWRNFAIAGR